MSLETSIPEDLSVSIEFVWPDLKALDMIKAAGFRRIRVHFVWSNVEREKEVYDFETSRYDWLTSELLNRSIRPIYIFIGGNSLYENTGTGEAYMSVRTEDARQAFAHFAGNASEHYRGKGVIWEIWNEPDILNFWDQQPSMDSYMALVNATAPAIRHGDPDSMIIAPAISGADFDNNLTFLKGCFERGLVDLVDAVSVHPYRLSPPETFAEDISHIRALIEQYSPDNSNFPIVVSEWGYSGTWDSLDEEIQGKYLARMFLTNLYLGIPVSNWYNWRDGGNDTTNPEHHFGTVDHYYKEKPAYYAMQTLSIELYGKRFIRRLDSLDDDYLLIFSDGLNEKIAGWTIDNKTHEVQLPSGQNVQLTDEPHYFAFSSSADINKDGKVDIMDLQIIALHFGQTNAHQNWNVTADVIASNEIDIYDIIWVASRFT
jgi:hypothetical protein